MKKFSLQQVTSITEIIASVAVLVSLFFVVHSINQNTKAIQSSNDNFLYELENQRLISVTNSPGLTAAIVKNNNKETLSRNETQMYKVFMYQSFNMWEMAFSRFKNGLLPEDQWVAWDDYWTANLPEQYPVEWWKKDRQAYREDFRQHVDAAYGALVISLESLKKN